MKILYYSPHPHHDIVSDVGYSVHQLEMIKAFKQLGHTVELCIMGGENKDQTPDYIQNQGKESGAKKLVKALLPKVLWNTLRDYLRYIKHDKVAYLKLEEQVLEFKPDIIYERSEYLLKSGVGVAQKHKIKHILEVNAPFIDEWEEFEGKSLLTNYAHRVEEYKLKNTSLVSCISTTLRNHLFKKYSIKSTPSVIVTNGVDLDKFPILSEKVSTSNSEITIGFVGSILPYHGVDNLIDAFANLYNQYKDLNLNLLIVGDGMSLNDLKNRAVKLNIENKVTFTGKVDRKDLKNYLSKMDVCVLAKTKWYCSPIKLFEYASSSKAILAPNTEPVSEVFTHGKDAFLVEKQNIEAGLKELIANADLRKSLASESRQLMESSYQWRTLAEKNLKALG